MPLEFSNYLSSYFTKDAHKIICISNSVNNYWAKYLKKNNLKTIYYGLSEEKIGYFSNSINSKSFVNNHNFEFLY